MTISMNFGSRCSTIDGRSGGGTRISFITVPGEFFDVNPGKRRRAGASRFRQYVRFSFGPSMATMELALSRLEQLVAQHMK